VPVHHDGICSGELIVSSRYYNATITVTPTGGAALVIPVSFT
jgi:hypothetical protein